MLVGVAIYEVHIGHARSLKDKRAVVKSIRDRIRSRHSVSAAEVAFQELHQRSRVGVAVVANNESILGQMFQQMADEIESRGDVTLTGWHSEILPFDGEVELTGEKY